MIESTVRYYPETSIPLPRYKDQEEPDNKNALEEAVNRLLSVIHECYCTLKITKEATQKVGLTKVSPSVFNFFSNSFSREEMELVEKHRINFSVLKAGKIKVNRYKEAHISNAGRERLAELLNCLKTVQSIEELLTIIHFSEIFAKGETFPKMIAEEILRLHLLTKNDGSYISAYEAKKHYSAFQVSSLHSDESDARSICMEAACGLDVSEHTLQQVYYGLDKNSFQGDSEAYAEIEQFKCYDFSAGGIDPF